MRYCFSWARIAGASFKGTGMGRWTKIPFSTLIRLRVASSLSLIVIFSFAVLAGCAPVQPKADMQADVIVVGGGTGGTAAAIQSARSGAKTILVCENPWLGGMLTAAGVSCTDGNHNLPSGMWSEFREAVYTHYGTRNLATGWVSNFNFEPHVGAQVFKTMVAKEANLTVLFRHHFVEANLAKDAEGMQYLTSVTVSDNNGGQKVLSGKVYIDATELGDLLAAAGCSYDVGLEPEDVSGEIGYGVSGSYGVVQDLTYAAILKDYGAGADKTIEMPRDYDAAEFACSSSEDCNDTTKLYSKVDAQRMLNYGRLPNNKFMINWPSNGNDFFTDIIHRSADERAKALDSAKQKTLRFIYYIQTQLGKKHIGLADDEFDTPDLLPYMPYHRESRRLKGMVRFTSADMIVVGEKSNVYRTGISVGDYPIDHHHRMYPGEQPDLTFVPVPSYNIPAGALVPTEVSNLLVCDKSISVSNIMNGTTRLQPVVLLTGQAAGIMAALAAQKDIAVEQLSVREVQQHLLEAKAYVMPYIDVKPDDAAWHAIQSVGASGLLMGKGVTEGWSNKTYFYPDSLLAATQLIEWAQSWGLPNKVQSNLQVHSVTNWDLEVMFAEKQDSILQSQKLRSSVPKPLTRREIAVWLHEHIKPFDKQVDWEGRFVEGRM